MTAITLLDRTRARQHIDRNWMCELTKSQWKIVCHVFDRTLQWGRAECAISVPEFAGGCGTYTRGTGLGESTIYRVLGELVKLGVLRKTERPGRKTIYGLDLTWGLKQPAPEPTESVQHEEATDMPMPPSKRSHAQAAPVALPQRKAAAPTPPKAGGVRGLTPPKTGGDKVGREDLLEEGKTLGASPARVVPLTAKTHSGLEAVLEVARRTADDREAKRRAREARTLRVGDLQSRWDEAMREHAPDAVRLTWTPKTRGQFKAAVKAGTFAQIDHVAMMQHVVKHWTLIGRTAMSWMKDFPAQPSALFVASLLPYFVRAYLDREQHIADLNAYGIDGLRAKYRRGGMDVQAAEAAAKAELAAQGGLSRQDADALRDQLARSEDTRRKQERMFKERLKAEAKAKAADDEVARADRMRAFDQDGAE
jgi:hypothetical protein